jgi:poly(3-hydroxybutyrate) depolymerase
VRELWLRLRALVARLSTRLFRREPAPGRFEPGRAWSWRGRVATAPLAGPERDYLVYVPRGWSRWRRAPLLVLCHGCKQTPEDIAGLARVTLHADRTGALVLLPRQAREANAFGCWNWFDGGTARGAGEAAIVAAQIVAVRRAYRARRERVWVAGISAGGALAAVLGLRFPRLVRGVLVHSGLACGAASSVASALGVMRLGPDNDVARIGEAARAAQGDEPLRVALLAIHGDRDNVVAPVNAVALVDQYLRFNAHPAADGAEAAPAALLPTEAASDEPAADRYPARCRDWRIDGALVARHVIVEGLGHAWSGGDGAFAFADPRGPDALACLARFATDAAP